MLADEERIFSLTKIKTQLTMIEEGATVTHRVYNYLLWR